MKKSELKKELEVAKATLELAMVALRVAAEKNNLKSSIKPPMIPIYQLKRLMDKFKKNQTIIPNPEPQAGDKIVEGNNNNSWFTKNDDGTYTIKLNPNTKIFEWIAKEDDSKVTRWNEPILNDFNEQEEINRANYEEFKQRGKEPKKETPLSDLNKEVQEEQSYIIQAKEAVDKFMPLVNGWRANDPCGLRDAEANKIVWSLSDHNHKKAAIKVAIAHFELIQKQGGWLTHIDCVQIINELQKMLSE